jgi:hypothetical protein
MHSRSPALGIQLSYLDNSVVQFPKKYSDPARLNLHG